MQNFESTLCWAFSNHITILSSTQKKIKIIYNVAILMVTGDDEKISFLFIRGFGHHNEK
jgi:hypothetical protein